MDVYVRKDSALGSGRSHVLKWVLSRYNIVITYTLYFGYFRFSTACIRKLLLVRFYTSFFFYAVLHTYVHSPL